MKLEGTVEHVIYENADSGYAVFEVDAGGTDVVVAGNVGGVDNGMSVTVYGHMVNHPSYGEQFRAETIEARLPEDRTAILSYLSSGVLPSVSSRASMSRKPLSSPTSSAACTACGRSWPGLPGTA